MDDLLAPYRRLTYSELLDELHHESNNLKNANKDGNISKAVRKITILKIERIVWVLREKENL